MLSARCDRCHQSVAGGQTVCPHCGGTVSEESGDLRPLLPEAEPPLPAAHEALRTRTPPRGAERKDPTPLPRRRDPTPARKDPTPMPKREELGDTPLPQRESRQVVAAIAEPPPSVPGPMEDPSSWFEKSEQRAAPTPAIHELVTAPIETPRPPEPEPVHALPGVPMPTSAVPALTERRGAHRALIAIALCVLVGVVVGWLLSNPAPTPEERAHTRGAPATPP